MKKLLLLITIAISVAFGQSSSSNANIVVQGTSNYCADAGSNDTYACSLSPALIAYNTGWCGKFKANTVNTTAATINFNSLGAKTIKKPTSTTFADLDSNDIRAGQVVEVCYDGTNMILQGTGTVASERTGSFVFSLDGGGSAISTGAKGWVQIPYAGTITGHEFTCDQSGSIVLDLWKDTYTNFPPTVADTITAAAKPTLSATQKQQDSTLTGWTTSITAKDYIRLNVDSAATVTYCVLTVYVTKN